jgi:hypothetical protein
MSDLARFSKSPPSPDTLQRVIQQCLAKLGIGVFGKDIRKQRFIARLTHALSLPEVTLSVFGEFGRATIRWISRWPEILRLIVAQMRLGDILIQSVVSRRQCRKTLFKQHQELRVRVDP